MVNQEDLKSKKSIERVKIMTDHVLATLDKEVDKRMKLVMPDLSIVIVS